MLDLRSIREDPEPARAALARRGAAEALDELLRLDERRRELLPEVEERRRAAEPRLRARSRRRSAPGEDAEPLIAEMREVSAEVKELEAELAEVESRARRAASRRFPTFPSPRRRTATPRTTRWSCARSASGPSSTSRSATTSTSGSPTAGSRWRRPAEASGSRFAYLLGRPGAGRAGAGAPRDRAGARRGVRAGGRRRCSSARARCSAPASSPASGR